MQAVEYRSEQEMFQYIVDELKSAKEKELQKQSTHDADLYDNADVVRRLKITSKTAERWRKKGILKFMKIGGKIYYRKEDIEALVKARL